MMKTFVSFNLLLYEIDREREKKNHVGLICNNNIHVWFFIRLVSPTYFSNNINTNKK